MATPASLLPRVVSRCSCFWFVGLLGAVLVAGGISARAAESLNGAASSFVRSHAQDPVSWLTWGEEAFARARREDKPLYIHVGNTGSELARAMERQSFSNPTIAAKLNEAFVCVMVDREEMPAVAVALQTFIRKERQQNGWPANVWLTPELKPFDGGGYLPPSEEWGKEGLTNVLQRITAAWTNDRAGVRKKAGDILMRLAAPVVLGKTAEPASGAWRAAADGWRQSFPSRS